MNAKKGNTVNGVIVAVAGASVVFIVLTLLTTPISDQSQKIFQEIATLETWEPNFVIVPLPSAQNPIYIVAARAGIASPGRALDEAFKRMPEGWQHLALLDIKGNEGNLKDRIQAACEELKEEGYDIETARLWFHLI